MFDEARVEDKTNTTAKEYIEDLSERIRKTKEIVERNVKMLRTSKRNRMIRKQEELKLRSMTEYLSKSYHTERGSIN